jgi:hypothetical protein
MLMSEGDDIRGKMISRGGGGGQREMVNLVGDVDVREE